MSLVLFLFTLALALSPSRAIDDGTACRFLTNLLEDLPRRIPTTPFKSNEGNFTVSLSCGSDLSDVDPPVWCMLFNDAKCTCNTTTDLDVTISGLNLQWNVSESKVVFYDGTLIGCFQEERLVSMIYTSGTDEKPVEKKEENLWIVQISSAVAGIIFTLIFVLPCCGLSYFMTLTKKGGAGTAVAMKAFRRMSQQYAVHNANVKARDIRQGTRIGNGRFGEVRKAEVTSICEESPLQNIACIKVFQESQSNNMQKTEALRRVEFKKNVAPHVNIINYLGACSSGKKVTLVVELGVFGTLYSFLEAKKRAQMQSRRDSYSALDEGRIENAKVAYARGCLPNSKLEDIFTAPLERALTNEDVLAIAEQIAKGLLHLNQQSIVHQRLTCESVYIGANYCIKVGGFVCKKTALVPPESRRPSMNENGPQLTERTPNGRQLAWWSPPEVIESLSYSQASDVWSFAMTVWELASDGDTPMQDVGADRTTDLPEIVRNRGSRPRQPTICSDALFGIMQECWQAEPLTRPGLHYVSQRLCQQPCTSREPPGPPIRARSRRLSPLHMPDLVEEEEEQ